MARIKHIALHTPDPAKTADFYKDVFGLQELNRRPRDTGDDGVWLTDGYIYFAILKYGSEDAPNLGHGPSTVEGVHHIGFYVDGLEDTVDAAKALGATECPGSLPIGRKYKGPDGLMIDLIDSSKASWDRIIKAKTQLLHAVPVPEEAPVSAD